MLNPALQTLFNQYYCQQQQLQQRNGGAALDLSVGVPVDMSLPNRSRNRTSNTVVDQMQRDAVLSRFNDYNNNGSVLGALGFWGSSVVINDRKLVDTVWKVF